MCRKFSYLKKNIYETKKQKINIVLCPFQIRDHALGVTIPLGTLLRITLR
jgi:hypothetical protein